ncbi:DUF4917 family protein [Ideonella paludis]|uniref:DUF4917 family protein n=1 Tax=Ideonella paludis TaxID=1233411 RepID=A0ABS5DST9_9BURK|nr:DUF4917 family protein [Ideonella paludis]MBQ0934203.1 DUF4917 family protein [Ideonella paludis]
MPEIQKWADIKAPFLGGALLLGNGASMAVHSGFGYASLRLAAEQHGHLTSEVAEIFKSFETSDFELVLRRLWEATLVNKALGVEPGKVEEAYRQVRRALIATVRQVHISYEDAKQYFEPMSQFMKGFKTVFCLNYDLLVYWAMMASQHPLGNWFKDCFLGGGQFCEDWEVLRKPYRSEGSTLIFYPHGSLITARRAADHTERKITVGDFSRDLLENILGYWEKGWYVPLFVSEGTSVQKRNSIAGSNYLTRVYSEVLPRSGDSLVIYGWAAAEQDKHIWTQLCGSNSRLRRAAVSVYGGNQSGAQEMEDALKAAGVSEVFFFDAESPGCWIHPLRSNTHESSS